MRRSRRNAGFDLIETIDFQNYPRETCVHRTPHCLCYAARHRDMGFHDGWGTVADQLAALAPKFTEEKEI